MKIVLKIAAIIAFIYVIGAFIVSLLQLNFYDRVRDAKHDGMKLVAAIEQFKKVNLRYPETIGIVVKDDERTLIWNYTNKESGFGLSCNVKRPFSKFSVLSYTTDTNDEMVGWRLYNEYGEWQ